MTCEYGASPSLTCSKDRAAILTHAQTIDALSKTEIKNKIMNERLIKLWRYLDRSQKKRVTGVAALMIIAAVAEVFSIGMMIPFLGVLLNPELVVNNSFLSPLIRHFELFEREQLIFGVTALFVGAVLIAALIRVLLIWSQIGLAYRIGSDLGEAVYRRILFQQYRFHADINSSQVIVGVSRRADQVVNEVVLPCMVVVSSGILIFAIAGMLAVLNPLVALSAAFGFGLIYFVVMLATRFRISRYGKVVNRQHTEVVKALQEALGGIRDIIIDGTQDLHCKIYKRADLPLRRAQASNLIIGGVPRYVIEGVTVALIAVFSCWLASTEGGLQAMIPTLGVLVLGAQKTLPLLQLAYVNFTQIQGGQAALEDVLQLLDRPLPVLDKSAVVEFSETIHLDDVWFRYQSESAWVLRKLSLQILKGDRIGFVGGTGSGKSTLLDIVMGLLSPECGALLIDGVHIAEQNCGAWQRHIAHVPQSIYLTDASVLENIAFGVPVDQIDLDRARRAAEMAQIAEVIEAWELGYQTVVGERGARLSGGQRQRIGLARALYKNADVIVLDEATSALDNETETAVMSAIEALDSDITILIVAHRLTTLRGCNKIVRLENGEIGAIGTYAELVA